MPPHKLLDECNLLSDIIPLILTTGLRARRAKISNSKGVTVYGLDQSGIRRSCSLLRNQLLRERKTLNLQKEDAHSDPRFCGRGWVSAVELRLRKLCCGAQSCRR